MTDPSRNVVFQSWRIFLFPKLWKLETWNPSRDITSSRLLKYFLRSTTSPSLPSNSTIQTIIPRHGTLQPHRNHPRPSNRASSNVTRDNHRTLAEMIWCFVNSSAHSSLVAGYRGLKDMQDGCRCADPLHSLRYLDRLAHPKSSPVDGRRTVCVELAGHLST